MAVEILPSQELLSNRKIDLEVPSRASMERVWSVFACQLAHLVASRQVAWNKLTDFVTQLPKVPVFELRRRRRWGGSEGLPLPKQLDLMELHVGRERTRKFVTVSMSSSGDLLKFSLIRAVAYPLCYAFTVKTHMHAIDAGHGRG